MKQKLKAPGQIVNGTLDGHPFLNHKNHASGGALVQVPVVQSNVASVEGRKMKPNRPAVIAANAKGAV